MPGFDPDWKHCKPCCKFPPKVLPTARVVSKQYHNTFGAFVFIHPNLTLEEFHKLNPGCHRHVSMSNKVIKFGFSFLILFCVIVLLVLLVYVTFSLISSLAAKLIIWVVRQWTLIYNNNNNTVFI